MAFIEIGSLVLKAMDLAVGGFLGRRKLLLTVHRAEFVATGRECYFVKATNVSRNRDMELTHVWFACVPEVQALAPERPLPKRLKPDESWETWVDAGRLPPDLGTRALKLARARLSSGIVVKSRAAKDLPGEGYVSGGERNA